MTRGQLVAMWIGVAYFGAATLMIGGRAAWGFLRLASEYREEMLPRSILLSVADSAAQDFQFHALLVGVGFVGALAFAVWVQWRTWKAKS